MKRDLEDAPKFLIRAGWANVDGSWWNVHKFPKMNGKGILDATNYESITEGYTGGGDGITWTRAENHLMLTLKQRGFTRGQIATILGRTRGAVCGRLKRIYLEQKPSDIKHIGINLVDLKYNECHNVVNGGLYCGLPVYKKQYCEGCFRKIYKARNI